MFLPSLVTTPTPTTSNSSARTAGLSSSGPGTSSTTSASMTWRRTSRRGSSGTPGSGTRSCAWWRGSPRRTVTTTSEFWPSRTTRRSWCAGPTHTIPGVGVTWGPRLEVTRLLESSQGEVTVRMTRDTTPPSCSQVRRYCHILLFSSTQRHNEIINAWLQAL